MRSVILCPSGLHMSRLKQSLLKLDILICRWFESRWRKNESVVLMIDVSRISVTDN